MTFSKSLSEHLDQVVVGPPLYDRLGKLQNMVVYPVFPLQLGTDPPDIITLSEALNKGLRLTDTGVVSRVHVDNPLPTSILAGESEILIGSTQLRSVQFSCLLAPQRKAALPVNCVEEGRPTQYQAEFERADACPWPLRSYKMEQLARFGEPRTTPADAGATMHSNRNCTPFPPVNRPSAPAISCPRTKPTPRHRPGRSTRPYTSSSSDFLAGIDRLTWLADPFFFPI